MRLRRLPPSAAPLGVRDLVAGVAGLVRPAAALARIERELGAALEARDVVLMSSGRAALVLILRALTQLADRRRVILPAYTCYSVPAAIVRSGCEPVPCDIDAATLDFDFAQLERLLAESPPLAVVSSHLFGRTADVARARQLAHAHQAFVIDDAAQAFGMRTAAGPHGMLGDVGFYSFGRGKAVTLGSGSAIVTARADIGEALRREYAKIDGPGVASGCKTLVEAAMMTVFLRPSLYWMPAALPFLGLGETVYETDFTLARLSGAQAGLLRDWRERLRRPTPPAQIAWLH